MKFSTTQIAAICLATSTYAAAITPRALSDFTTVLATVQADVDACDVAVNAYNGDTTPVEAKAQILITDLNNGNTALVNQPQLSLPDTITLNNAVQSFKSHAQTLVNDLITQRPNVQLDSNCALVRTKVNAISVSGGTLIDTMVSKVNPLAQSIADKSAAELKAILAQAVDAYSTTNCP